MNNRIFQKFQQQVEQIRARPEPVKVHCDKCGVHFVPSVKDRPTPGGGKQRRFRCPHCKKWYVVANFTPLAVRILADIDRVEIELATKPGDPTLTEQLTGLRELLRPEVTGSVETKKNRIGWLV